MIQEPEHSHGPTHAFRDIDSAFSHLPILHRPMFTSLLPGLRSLRSAFLSGALLLGSLYILIRGDSTSVPRVRASAHSILDITPQMPLILLILACFLIGSLYTTALEGAVDWIHRWLVLAEPEGQKNWIMRRLVGALVPFSASARGRLSLEAARFFRELSPTLIGDTNIADEAATRHFADTVFADVLWMDGKLCGSDLRGLYTEYRSEGELRLAIALLLPLSAFATCYALRLDGGWIALVVGVVLVLASKLASYGMYYYRRAHSLLAHHIADGTLLAPCMATLQRNVTAPPSIPTAPVIN